jgi:hypothetical protein
MPPNPDSPKEDRDEAVIVRIASDGRVFAKTRDADRARVGAEERMFQIVITPDGTLRVSDP